MSVGNIPLTSAMSAAAAKGAPAGEAAMMAAIVNEDIRLAGGTAEDLTCFFGIFDPLVDVDAIWPIV